MYWPVRKLARGKLSEAFIHGLAKTFEDGGVESLEELKKEQPAQYHNIIAKLMPKLMELSGPDGNEIPVGGTIKYVKPSE